MTVKKLTDADRKEILDLYRHTGETTSTLAERYGVSNSTISRFLKVTLSEDEYETLISAKRAARTPGGEDKQVSLPKAVEPVTTELEPEVVVTAVTQEEPEPEVVVTAVTQEEPELKTTIAVNTTKPVRRPATRSPQTETPATLADVQLELLPTGIAQLDSTSTSLDEDVSAEVSTIAQMLGEELLDESEDEDDEDLEDEDEEDFEENRSFLTRQLPAATFVQVLPLSEANLPRTCYIVIDRTAELIARPLRDFGDLGQIPSQEVQQKTLPVFDNHRVARRFSSKRDRVIKVPDSRMLQKTRSHLQAKGITRLLFDGRVYSLSSN